MPIQACVSNTSWSNCHYAEQHTFFKQFQWFYFEFQQLYSQWEESKDSIISEPGGYKGSHSKQSVYDTHPSGSSVLTVRLEPPTSRFSEL